VGGRRLGRRAAPIKGRVQWTRTRRVGDLATNRQGAVRFPRHLEHGPRLPGRALFAPAKGQAGAARARGARAVWLHPVAAPEAMASGLGNVTLADGAFT
jgi:hypothetical protein